MPNKPTTLKEEFFRDFRHLDGNRVWDNHKDFFARWFMAKLTSHNTELLQKIEGLKGNYLYLDDHEVGSARHSGYEEALDDLLERLGIK